MEWVSLNSVFVILGSGVAVSCYKMALGTPWMQLARYVSLITHSHALIVEKTLSVWITLSFTVQNIPKHLQGLMTQMHVRAWMAISITQLAKTTMKMTIAMSMTMITITRDAQTHSTQREILYWKRKRNETQCNNVSLGLHSDPVLFLFFRFFHFNVPREFICNLLVENDSPLEWPVPTAIVAYTCCEVVLTSFEIDWVHLSTPTTRQCRQRQERGVFASGKNRKRGLWHKDTLTQISNYSILGEYFTQLQIHFGWIFHSTLFFLIFYSTSFFSNFKT